MTRYKKRKLHFWDFRKHANKTKRVNTGLVVKRGGFRF